MENTNENEKFPQEGTSFLDEGTTTTTKVNWLTVTRGSLVQKVDEETEGSKSRVNKLGNKVWEKEYEKAGVKIESMWIEEGTYGKQIIFNTMIGDESFNIAMHLDGSYARSFMKQIFHIDPTKHFIFRPFSFQGDKGKTITGISMIQNKEKVKKEYPEGTPEVEWKEKGGKFIVNNIQQSERDEFLEKALEQWITDNDLTPDFPVNVDKEVTKEEKEAINRRKKQVKETLTDNEIGEDFFDEE